MAATSDNISVAIARDPALVRTVRLVAAAVARRTGQDEDFVEEVRLAVGEACALLVAGGTRGRVKVDLNVAERLRVVVGSDSIEPVPVADSTGIDPWALLSGLAEDFEMRRQDGRTSLAMSWSLG